MNPDVDMQVWVPRNEDENSFEDSERFEDDDSQVSWGTSVDGMNQNWRGWSSCPSNGEAIQPGLSCVVYQYPASGRYSSSSTHTVVQQRHSRNENPATNLLSLGEIAARVCAEKWSFQQLEEMYQFVCAARARTSMIIPPTTIPEKIFLSFIVHCFPQSTDEIRMYSTLANGTCEQYNGGNTLYQIGAVRDVSQTGFLLSANVQSATIEPTLDGRQNMIHKKESYHVTVKVDRCRIVECTCECSSRSGWCQHVVALCIYRIHQKHNIKFNETIADAINSMSDFELRKLVQWHINEIPRKCIPGFQNLIDQIKNPHSEINQIHGAPDPTDGGHEPVSRFDFPEIEDKVRRLLCKYCLPTPSVHCDVQYLSATQHPTTIEWNTLIKPWRAREPEGMWNLLQMVREMFARGDENSVALLRTITDECLSNSQVLLWWYITKLVQSGFWTQSGSAKSPATTQTLAQYNCSQLCDEVVTLWKCVAINPRANKNYRSQLASYLEEYHRNSVTRLKTVIEGAPALDAANLRADGTFLSNHQTALLLQTVFSTLDNHHLCAQNMKFSVDLFPGFYPALQMCHFLSENFVSFGVPTDAYFDLAAPDLSKTVKMVTPKSKKSKKKKKKSKRSRRSREAENDPLEGPSSRHHEQDELNGMWRVVHDFNNDTTSVDVQQDSTESGQESDVQSFVKPSKTKKGKAEMEDPDVNEALAAAFSPLDAISSRFLKCEAFATHGYRAEAVEEADKLIKYLLDSLQEQSDLLDEVLQEKLINSTSEDLAKSSSDSCGETSSADQDEEATRCSLESEKSTTEVETAVCKSNKFLSTLEKLLYVTKVLNGSPHYQRKVFWLALKSLSVTKFPLVTKHQQVALYYYEAEFVAILQQISISNGGRLGEEELDQVRAVAKKLIETEDGTCKYVASIALAQLVFEVLHSSSSEDLGLQASSLHLPRRHYKPEDDELAVRAALKLLGNQTRFRESNFPISAEGIRRSKNELAMIMLTRFKDNQEMVAFIIDRILDPLRHKMYTYHKSNAAYFLERSANYLKYTKNHDRPYYPFRETAMKGLQRPDVPYDVEQAFCGELGCMSLTKDDFLERESLMYDEEETTSDEGLLSSSSSQSASSGACCSTTNHLPSQRSNYGLTKNNASTYASQQQQRKGSKSSDDDKFFYRKKKPLKKSVDAFVSNYLTGTEAYVYHMQELSKKVLQEAGGQHNNVFSLGNPSVGGTHRRLHLCSVIIAIYALGMNNRLSPSWNSRTYSTAASWIAGQVHDIGPSAVELIRDTWTSHFTPSEVATISDRAGPSTDPMMRLEAAKLALSVLPFSHSLNDEEVISALDKCREAGSTMLIQGLNSLDASQFRYPARSKPLFAAMKHWIDLSIEEEEKGGVNNANLEVYRNHPVYQMAMNQYPGMMPLTAPRGINSFNMQAPLSPMMQQQLNNPFNYRTFNTNSMLPHMSMFNNPPPSHHSPVVRLQQNPYLFPSLMANDQSRIHQSHSAPQLGTNQAGMPSQAYGEGMSKMDDIPAQTHTPTAYLMNAFRFGIRAMDCLATSQGEERQMYLKFGPSPPYCEEINKLYHVATKLGASQLLTFFNTLGRAVMSPYVLHQYAKDSTKFFPNRPYCQPQAAQQNAWQLPPTQSSSHPMAPKSYQNQMPNCRYPHVKFSSPGMIGNIFVQNGYHHVTGELFERTCEQYLQAIVNKLNSPRLTDAAEICSFVTSAYDAFQWIPEPIGRNLFEEFVRCFKKQKAFKKEIANAINNVLNQLG